MKYLTIIFIFFIFIYTSFSNDWKEVDHFNHYDDDTTNINWALDYWSIDSYDENHCAAAGNFKGLEPIIRYTSDGGDTWSVVIIDSVIYKIVLDSIKVIDTIPSKVYDVNYFSEKLCVAAGDSGSYWVSRDGCRNWVHNKKPGERIISEISIYDEKFGALIGNRGIHGPDYTLYFTYDGFESMEKVEFDNSVEFDFLGKVFILSPDDIFLKASNSLSEYGAEDFIISSHDGGKTWKSFEAVDREIGRLSSIFFLNKNLGYVGGGRQKEPYSSIVYDKIFRTTDGGASFEVLVDTLTYPTFGLKKVFFTDSQNGYAFGEGSVLWKTSDIGVSWHKEDSIKAAYYYIKDITYPKKGIMYGITKFGGRIYKYENHEIGIPDQQITEVFSSRVYPNPATDQITITLDEAYTSTPEIDIIDMLGYNMKTEYNICDREITINTSILNPGIYFLRIRSGSKVETRKFVVVR